MWVPSLGQEDRRRRKWQPTPVFLPGESHEQRSQVVQFQFSSVQFSRSVVSNSLRPHGLQHTRPPYPSPAPGIYSNSCPLSQVMPSNHLILCHPLLLPPSVFPSIRVFSNKSALSFTSVAQLGRLFVTPWTAAHQASLSITNCWRPPKPMSIDSVMPSNHLILCCPLLLLPSIFPSISVFSNESALRIRWPKYWSFSFNISPSNEHQD